MRKLFIHKISTEFLFYKNFIEYERKLNYFDQNLISTRKY